jgi:hypothetical protein
VSTLHAWSSDAITAILSPVFKEWTGMQVNESVTIAEMVPLTEISPARKAFDLLLLPLKIEING